MKIKLLSLVFGISFLTVACGGGSGAGTEIFNFFGLWFASFTRTVNTCDLEARSSGSTLIDISQSLDVVTASTGLLTFQGRATANDFTAVDTTSLVTCNDGEPLTNVTATLEFFGASGDSVDSARISFFGDCPGVVEQCQLSYEGSAIRVSGGGGASGEVVDENTTNDVMDPLF